jgi:histidinol phosphatase-like PHP family hydrolase
LHRLDLAAPQLRRAVETSEVMFAISTDAHHTSAYANAQWGVAQARRGWVPASRVVNTFKAAAFMNWQGLKRNS